MSERSGGDGIDSPEDPDIEDTVRRAPPGGDPARTPEGADEDTVVRGVPPHDADEDAVVRRPGGGLLDRSVDGRPFLPDDAPIQRFDERPRFEHPSSPDPAPSTGPTFSPQAASPSATTPPRHGTPPGIDATASPRRRGLLVPALAFGCAVLLLLGVGGVLTAVWLGGRDADPVPAADSPSSSAQTEPGVWQLLEEGQEPAGSADDLQQVLAQNPLLEATLQAPEDCELPPTDGGAIPAGELAGYLEAGAGCLESSWGGALGAEGIDFTGPAVVVYTVDALPEDSACDPVRFSEATPVVCQADNTLYWPAAWDPGFSNTTAEETPQLYMWHLSYSYALFAMGSASLDGYFGTLLIALADEPERAEESQRRYALQVSCLASATTSRLPEGIRPAGRVADFVTSVEAQAAPATAGEPSATARAVWVGVGQDGEGVLRACDTWSAAPEAVA